MATVSIPSMMMMSLVLLIYYYYYYYCYYSPLDCCCTVPDPAIPDLVVVDILKSDRVVQCVVGLPIVTMTFFFDVVVYLLPAVHMEARATVFHSPWMMIADHHPAWDNIDPVAVVDNLQMQVPTMEDSWVYKFGMVYSCMHYDYSVEVASSSLVVVEEEEE